MFSCKIFLFFPPVPAFLRTSFSNTLFLVSWKKRNKLHSRRFPCDCSLFSVHHCCVFVFVLFFFFLFYFKSSKEGLLNRWRWVWGTGLGPKTHLWLSPQLGSDSEQWTHTQEELSTTGCKWTAGVTSLVWITFFKGNDIEISVFAF